MQLVEFEQQLKNNVINLAGLKQADPIKTTEERRAEWLQARRGRFTASEFHRLIASRNKDELSKGAMTYALEKAVEIVANMDESDRYISLDMQWGIDREPEAVEAFTLHTGLTVDHTGDNQKLHTLGSDIACTPDGLIGTDAGIEIKCPKSKTHFGYLHLEDASDLKDIAPEYYWQIQGCLYITQRKHWHFVSYDPRFKEPRNRLHTFKVSRNQADIDFLEQRLVMAIAYRNELLEGFLK